MNVVGVFRSVLVQMQASDRTMEKSESFVCDSKQRHVHILFMNHDETYFAVTLISLESFKVRTSSASKLDKTCITQNA